MKDAGFQSPCVLNVSDHIADHKRVVTVPWHVASLRGVADAVVVGSAALDAVSAASADRRPEALHGFVSMLVAAGKT